MKFRFLLLITFTLVLCQACATQQSSQNLYDAMSIEELKQNASELHPSGIYMLSGKLLKNGNKDDSVFWFYVGQLRYRVYLAANPNLDPSGDPALFGSLNATLGQSINEYAGGNPDTWVKQIEKAKKWDADNPNKLTPKENNALAYNQVLSGLDQMIKHIGQNKDSIRKQRAANGLENR